MQRLARGSAPAGVSRRLLAGALALAAGAVLTACGQAQPGVAAEINGESISVVEVQEHVAQFFESYPQARGSAQPDLVAAFAIENFLRNRVVDDIGEAYDLEPTQGDLEAIAERDFQSLENYTQAVANEAIPASRPDLVMEQLRSYWIQNALRDLQAEEIGTDEEDLDAVNIATRDIILDFSEQAEVKLNPRFGSWNGSIVTSSTQAGTGSLSVPITTAPGPGAPASGG